MRNSGIIFCVTVNNSIDPLHFKRKYEIQQNETRREKNQNEHKVRKYREKKKRTAETYVYTIGMCKQKEIQKHRERHICFYLLTLHANHSIRLSFRIDMVKYVCNTDTNTSSNSNSNAILFC